MRTVLCIVTAILLDHFKIPVGVLTTIAIGIGTALAFAADVEDVFPSRKS